MFSRKLSSIAVFALVLAVAALPATARAATSPSRSEQQALVNQARATFMRFREDPNLTGFREHERDARAFLIVPTAVRAGLIFGGSGGRAVVVARSGRAWNGPSFYTVGTASVGLQAGVDVSEIVVVVMTQRGLDTLLSGSVKPGVDASIAAGPIGVGAGTAPKPNTDFVYYCRSKGLYAGVSFEGAVIKPNREWNRAYYGAPASPKDILVGGSFHNTGSRRLLETVENSLRTAGKR